ncbi:MAG TPA: NAD-dependent succinate-semialdehyde dehydrogenase [Aquabacterium sp.]|nr:NAD-dependent succinate-semialdehyde dehydrogenase [Aquabacterium sp.]HQC97386.1 NAD-dependent succinate-semialdehyde dehydrogenase [Aquabacterium sp.]
MHDYPDVLLHIDGQWRAGRAGATLPVHDPATGQRIGSVAVAETADLDEALAAAERGFALWRRVPAAERAQRLQAAARLLRERADGIARLLTLENGKPLAEAQAEVRFGADIVDWFAAEGQRVAGRIVAPRGEHQIAQVFKEPVGPVAAFTPWNFPINQLVRKLCGALATGCSVIAKAPEETPASPAELVRAFVDAGVPAGVIGLVYGRPEAISSHLIPHPVVRKVTFTGSTAVGKQLAALAGAHMKRVTMELGGHAPVIVAEDCDVDRAAKIAAAAKFRNAGQVCISPTRFLVAQPVKARFVAGLAAAARTLQLGHGLEAATRMGPLANPRRLDAVQRLVGDAVERGAQVAAGGERLGHTGHFYLPTVLDDVPRDSLVFNEEPFGPVAAVRGYDTLDEAIAEANRLPYGLAAYAFTSDLRTAHALAQRLEVGMLWINQPAPAWPELPFGGVKDSGHGSEGGPESLESYLNTKTVSTLVI